MLILWSTTAWACPFCATETGRAVYATIFEHGFGSTLALVLAPVPALVLVAWAVPRLVSR
jgi:hypothetical protein